MNYIRGMNQPRKCVGDVGRKEGQPDTQTQQTKTNK